MRSYPNMSDEYDKKDVENLNAEPWMFEILRLNPAYCMWGNFEDYMISKGQGGGFGWNSSQQYENIREGLWGLDDLNECVNFYFAVDRDTEDCVECGRTGFNKQTEIIYKDWFYKVERDGIRESELSALISHKKFPVDCTLEQANEMIKGDNLLLDSVDHYICVKALATELGVFGLCPVCNGNCYIYTEPKARLALQLWILHPRKGCSRGVYIRYIMQNDLPEIYKWLKYAAERNAQRFSKVMEL